jgi:N-acetylglucosamine malate deacetylase 1
MNQDHRRIYDATLIATRPTMNFVVKNLLCFETPSSTDNPRHSEVFNPNYFVDIKLVIKKKIKALQQYNDELQPYPLPRSEESIINRAKYWGSRIGVEYAEAFYKVREIS